MVSKTEQFITRASASSDGGQHQHGHDALIPEGQHGGGVPPADPSPAAPEAASGDPQPATRQTAAPQPARVRVGEHGEPPRVRVGEHGSDLWAQARHILPDLATHGYVLVTGNAVKVWLALLLHTVEYGSVAVEGEDQPSRPPTRRPVPKPPKPVSPRPDKPKVVKKTKPTAKTTPRAKAKPTIRPQAAAGPVRLEGEWDNGSLARTTNLGKTAVHAAQNDLVALGWITKRSSRNAQGQFGGFRYAIQKPPVALPDAAKKRYEKQLNNLFGRAYDLQHLLESAEVKTVGGDCPNYADLLAFASKKLDDGRKMVVEQHLRNCAECRQRFKDILATDQEWGG
jgi:hypothetical protein